MKSIIIQFIRDERGSTNTVAIILMVTIVGVASMVGLAGIRDHITQEAGDIGAMLNSLDQSFSYDIDIGADDPPGMGEFSSSYVDDPPEFIDPAPGGAESGAPSCLVFETPAVPNPGDEGNPIP